MSRIGKAQAIALNGLEARRVVVEAQILSGLPAFHLVGLPDASLKEAKSRVEAAITGSGIKWKPGRLTVNLSPAELPKTGSGFDLAIALAILSGQIPQLAAKLENTILVGELGLDGQVRPVRGILPTVIGAVQNGFQQVIVPFASLAEAKLIPGIEVLGISSLTELFHRWEIRFFSDAHGTYPKPDFLETGNKVSNLELKTGRTPLIDNDEPDLAQVRGQNQARRALEVAAAGGHHLLFTGVPGVGKTMLANCLTGILPPLSSAQALDVTAIHSLAGTLPQTDGCLMTKPQFIAPHHTISKPALVGGGSLIPRPGAISLAHHGVLFLDEAPEFAPSTLDALREPLESGQIEVCRLRTCTKYPARFQLVLAANPCPCGNAGETDGSCRCTPYQKVRYRNRLSGPLLDRIDLQVYLYRPRKGQLSGQSSPESSQVVRQRVIAARQRQQERWGQGENVLNAQVSSTRIKAHLGQRNHQFLDDLVEKSGFSLRGADRLLRVAYTLADLAGQERPEQEAFLEAMMLRRINR